MWRVKPVELWKHQHETIEFAEKALRELGGCLLVSGCSTGKTLSSIVLAQKMGARRLLVITTLAAVSDTWRDQLNRYADWNLNVVCLRDELANKRKQLGLCRDHKDLAVVVNYTSAKLLAKELEAMNFDMVIADECHHLKGYNSQVSNQLGWAFRNVRYKLAMTATGWTDRPTDVFGQVRFLFPSHTKPARSNIPLSTPVLGAWYQFFERTVVYHTHNRVKIPIGYRRDGLAELTSKLAPFTYRVDTEKVVDLPPFIKHRKDVVLSPETRECYDTLDKHGVCHIAYDTVIAQFPPTELLRLHQITGGYYVNTEGKVVRLGGTPDKVTATLEILDSIGEEPVVIFTRFREDVAILQDYLAKNGYTSSVLVGGNNQLEEWKGGKTQILIANMAAGAAGVDLTRARLAIFYSVGFSATEMHQALYRVRRANSDKTKPVVYWLLIAHRTVDVHIWNTISDKSDNETLINESLTNPLANDIL